MLRKGKQKFGCRRVVMPFQQRLKVTRKILQLFHSRIDKKEVPIVSIFDLIFEFKLYAPFTKKIGSESNN